MDVEARGLHLLAEIPDVLLLAVVKFVALVKNLKEFYSGCAEHGRQGVAEEVRTAPLTEHLDDLLASGGESAYRAAEALAEGAGMDVDASVEAELLGDSAAGGADDACGMAFVHHHESVVLLGQIADLVHGGDVAVHAEDAIGADDAEPLRLGFLQAPLKVFHIGVFIAVTHCLAEPYAIYYRGVVEGVGDDCVVLGEERLEDAAVRIEAGSVEYGVLGVEVIADGLFQLLVKILLAADEADAAHAESALVHGLLGRGDEARVVCQAEIVVGAEVQRPAAVGKSDFGALGGTNRAFLFVQARFADGLELILQVFLEFSVHVKN